MGSKINPTTGLSSSKLSSPQSSPPPVQEDKRSSSIPLNQETRSRMGLTDSSFAAKVLRFFRSIAEALKLRRPSSAAANAQQEAAAARFDALAHDGGGLSPHPGPAGSDPEKARIIQSADAAAVKQSAFEKAAMQAFEQTELRTSCDRFCHAVKQATGEDVSKIMQRKGVKESDSMPESRTFTALPPWMEYQNNVRALARMRSEVPGADAERDLDGMTRTAAELTPNGLDLSDNELQPASRRYRDAGNHLSGFLRSCMSEDSDRNLEIAARHFQSYQSAVDVNLSGRPEIEKSMVHDLLLDGALSRLTLKERNRLAAALKADGGGFGPMTAVLEADQNETAQKILSAMRRHAKTGPFMPQRGFSSPSADGREKVRLALEAARSAQAERAAVRPAAAEATIRGYTQMIFNAQYSNLTAAEKPLADAGGSLTSLLETSAHDDDGGKTGLALKAFSDLMEKMHQENRQPTAGFRLSAPAGKEPDQESVRFLSSALKGKNEKGVQLTSDALFSHAWGRLPSQEKGAFLESLRHHSCGIEAAVSQPRSDYERRMLNCLITSMKNHPDVSDYVPARLSAYKI